MASGITIGDLFVRLGVDLTTWDRNITAAENRLESFGTRLFFLGSRVTAGVTVPIIAAGTAIAKLGLDFDKAMTESLAIMKNVTPELRSQMEDVALSLSETTKFSAKEAAQGYYSLASAGLTAVEAMNALPVAARFAQAGVFDLAKATEFLAGAQASLTINASANADKVAEMARIADVLTEANNRALGTIEDFANALTNKAGAALRLTGKDVEEGTAVLAAFAEQNIKGKTAGQQLWMVIRDLGIYAIKNSDAFKKFNISVFDSRGEMRNLGHIVKQVEDATRDMNDAQKDQMFNLLGIPLRSVAATKALIGYSGEIYKHEAALRIAGNTTQEVADKQMLALWNRISALGHSFQRVGIEIFQSFVPVFESYLVPALQAALDAFKAMGAYIAELPPGLKAVAVGALAVVAAVGPLTAMIGSFSLLASASMRGIAGMAGGLGRMATTLGLATGATGAATITTQQMVLAQNAAALAAMNAARANGAWGNALHAIGNRAAAQVAAQQAAAQAALASATATGTLTGAFTKFSTLLSSSVAWIGSAAMSLGALAAKLGVVYAAVNILWPPLQQLFTGWGKTAESTEEKTSALGAAGDVAAGAWGLFNDIITVSGGGLRELVKLLQQTVIQLGDTRENAGKAGYALIDLQREMGGIKPDTADNTIGWWETRLNRFQLAINNTKNDWQRLVLLMEGHEPKTDFALQAAATAGPRPRGFNADDWKIKLPRVEPWMLADDPFAQRDKMLGELDKGMDFPEQKKRKTAEETAMENMRHTILGINPDVKQLTAVWNGLTAAQKENQTIQLNLWETYEKMRMTAGGMIPQFEKLFEQQIAQIDLGRRMAQAGKDWSDTWTDGQVAVMAAADKMMAATVGMTDPQKTAFWKEHGSVIEGLVPRYNELRPAVQRLVLAYQAWQMALPPGSEFQEATQSAKLAMDELLAEVGAKNRDVMNDVHQFSEAAGETHRRATRNKLEQITADQEKEYKKQLMQLGRFTGVEHAEWIAHLAQLKQEQAKYVDSVERYEDLRYMQAIGVNAKILREQKKYTKEQIKHIIEQQEAWNRFMLKMQDAVLGIRSMGQIADILGLDQLGKALEGVSGGTSKVFEGMDLWRSAGDDMGKKIAGVAAALTGVVEAYQALADTAGRGNRGLAGALSGAMIGGSIGGGWGAAIGAIVGGITGLFMDDPGWEKLRKTVESKFRVNISEELAKQIDATAQALGSRTTAMYRHLDAIIAENGGVTAGNIAKWAHVIDDVFADMARGVLPADEAARTLDSTFGMLLDSGTAASGMVSQHIVELVKLERQYKTGSKAVKDFVDAQMSMAAGGFNKIVDAFFGTMVRALENAEDADTALEKQNGLHQKAAKLQAQIADYERDGVKNEKQRIALAIARVNLAATGVQIEKERAKQAAADEAITRMLGEKGQEHFDRMGRLASVMFNAAIASGRGLFDTLEAMGPALDSLSAAQKAFGFESTEAFGQLMKLRDFATSNPEIVEAISGLSEMMVGLHNAGFMTESAFAELGSTITSVFDELVGKGLSGEEAMQAMHIPLQRLWEMQQLFGYAVDEATQKLIDEAVASGSVGEKFMSATDKMVLGIDTLVGRLDLLLKHFGVNIPDAVDNAASEISARFSKLNPEVHVGITYYEKNKPPTVPGGEPESDPVYMAEGGVFTRPVVAGEAGPEAFIPLDRLFAELEAERRAALARGGERGGVYLDGRKVGEMLLPHHYAAIKKFRLNR